MALVNVSNATFDAALALVPAPWGPLTRSGTTTDLDTLPRVEPNSETKYEVVGQGSVHFFISYEELTNPAVLDNRLRKAYGIQFRFYEVQTMVEALSILFQDIDPLDVDAEQYQELMNLFVYLVPLTGNLMQKFSYSELSNDNKVDASFTISTAPSAAFRTVVNTSTGLITNYVWDWGDGTYSFEEDPAPHEYLVDANPVYVRLFAFGAGGVDIFTSPAQNVNVP
jgi:hypothetical protein